MPSIPDRIRNAVYNGYVIDDMGKWVPIAQMVEKEREFLQHLERGQVIMKDEWMSFEEARKKQQ